MIPTDSFKVNKGGLMWMWTLTDSFRIMTDSFCILLGISKNEIR